MVLNADPERERISLGIKQLTSDPFADFCEEYPKGSKVTTTVIGRDNKFVIVKVNEHINGTVAEEDVSSDVKEGDALDLFVTMHESRNYYLPLSVKNRVDHDNTSTASSNIKPQKVPPASSIGDMIKNKLSNDSDSA